MFCMGDMMLLATSCAPTQEKKEEINDSNTPLHLLQPDYQNPYGVPSVESIKENMDRVLHYLVDCTPTRVVNKNTGEETNVIVYADGEEQGDGVQNKFLVPQQAYHTHHYQREQCEGI